MGLYPNGLVSDPLKGQVKTPESFVLIQGKENDKRAFTVLPSNEFYGIESRTEILERHDGGPLVSISNPKIRDTQSNSKRKKVNLTNFEHDEEGARTHFARCLTIRQDERTTGTGNDLEDIPPSHHGTFLRYVISVRPYSPKRRTHSRGRDSTPVRWATPRYTVVHRVSDDPLGRLSGNSPLPCHDVFNHRFPTPQHKFGNDSVTLINTHLNKAQTLKEVLLDHVPLTQPYF